VRVALNELCDTFQSADEECLSKVDDLMVSLIEGADEEGDRLNFDGPTANILRTKASGASAVNVLPILLVSGAAIFAVSLASFFRLKKNNDYGLVPDATI